MRDCSQSTDLLDGFSIGRYEEKRHFFDLFAAKFESGAMRFLGEKLLRRWSPFKTRIPLLSYRVFGTHVSDGVFGSLLQSV